MKFSKNLEISIESEDLNMSVFSEIGANGLRFLQYDLLISKQGLTSFNGDYYGSLGKVTSDMLETTGRTLGRGATCYVQAGVYKPLGIPVAIKVLFHLIRPSTLATEKRGTRS